MHLKTKIALANAASLALAAASKGQVIVAYNFGLNGSSFTNAATTVAPNVTASGIQSTGDFGVDDQFSQDDGVGGESGWYSNNSGGNYLSVSSVASSFDTGFWVETIVTAAPGYAIDPASFEFYGGAGGSSAVRSAYIFDNVDGYPSSIGTNPTGAPIITGGDELASGDFTTVRGAGGTPAMNEIQVASFPADDVDLSSFTVRVYFDTQGNVSKNIDMGQLELDGSVVPVPVSLSWNNTGGTGDGMTWDTTSQNWTGSSGLTTYQNGDNVTFNDTNNNNYAVTLNSTVSPGSITVNNSVQNYVIGGAGSIAGSGSLTKSGTNALTLNTVNTYSGGTTVNAGTLVSGVAGALPDAAVTITGGTLELGTGLAQMTSLSISGNGVLDINNNHIIVSYGSSDPMATIYGYLKSGFNNGGWNGPGIISSAIPTANANSNNPQYGIGFSDGNDKINGHSIVSGLASGQIELKYTLLGDANLDGTVNGADFSILAANFGQGYTNWDQGNFLFTPAVNGADFSALAHNFGQGDSGAAAGVSQADIAALNAFAAANGLLADVPEPTTAGLLALGTLTFLARRKRGTASSFKSNSTIHFPKNFQRTAEVRI